MEPAPDVRVRRISPADWPALRDLRLRSISDAPDAFGQPLAEAEARTAEEWRRSARRAARGYGRTWLIAEIGGQSVGLVQGRRRRPHTLLLFSMWVDPSVRRLGVGRQLIDALEDWGRGWGAEETILWVMATNAAAIGFYDELGFSVVESGQDADAGARFGALAVRRAVAAAVDREAGDGTHHP